jgi:hypothetical protein
MDRSKVIMDLHTKKIMQTPQIFYVKLSTQCAEKGKKMRRIIANGNDVIEI